MVKPESSSSGEERDDSSFSFSSLIFSILTSTSAIGFWAAEIPSILRIELALSSPLPRKKVSLLRISRSIWYCVVSDWLHQLKSRAPGTAVF